MSWKNNKQNQQNHDKMSERINYHKRFYLAHPFDSRHYIREWELRIEEETGLELVNPFFDVKRPDSDVIEDKDVSLSSQASREDRYGLTDDLCQGIVKRDLKLMMGCYGTIVIIDGNLSYGTIQEMVYARLCGKYVLAVISNGHKGHPWLRYHSHRIFDSINDLHTELSWRLG